MVDVEMLKNAFSSKAPAVQQPKMIPNPNYALAQPVAQARAQQQEDPETAKLRAMMLKWLTIIIGGGAVILIAWRIVLKFF